MLTEGISTVNTLKNATDLITDKDMELLRIKPVSKHPDDWYLCYVLVDRKTTYDTYVTWIYNDTTKEFNWGHYLSDLDDAIEDFDNR